MKRKTCMMSARHRRFALLRTLAVMLAVFSSVAAMGQSRRVKLTG